MPTKGQPRNDRDDPKSQTQTVSTRNLAARSFLLQVFSLACSTTTVNHEGTWASESSHQNREGVKSPKKQASTVFVHHTWPRTREHEVVNSLPLRPNSS